jgi:hypothetical protein
MNERKFIYFHAELLLYEYNHFDYFSMGFSDICTLLNHLHENLQLLPPYEGQGQDSALVHLSCIEPCQPHPQCRCYLGRR